VTAATYDQMRGWGQAQSNDAGADRRPTEKRMIAHLRTYTINKGMMDAWLKLFSDELVARMKESGIEVHSAWVNEERTQFIWIRTYGESLTDVEKKEAALYSSEWWKKNVDRVRSHLAHRDIKLIRSI